VNPSLMALRSASPTPRPDHLPRFTPERRARARSGHHGRGPVDDLAPGDADHAKAERRELCVPAAITLERRPRGVEPEAVHLDDQSLLPPREVDLVAAEADVHLRGGQLRRPDQGEEALLGLGAGEGRRCVECNQRPQGGNARAARTAGKQGNQFRATREASRVRLGHRSLQLAGGDDRSQVENRSGRRGDGNST
jgi:hypothetical protein